MKKFNGTLIDINAIAQKLGNKCDQLLAIHALTGSDSTSYPYFKGKCKALKMLENYADMGLDIFGEENASIEQITKRGTSFFARLYGGDANLTMNELRPKCFTQSTEPPKLRKLPPTDEALLQHLLRWSNPVSHLEMCARIWPTTHKSL